MDKLIAHRGIPSKFVKENSVVAIKKALLSNEFLGVEFDVRVTKDQEFIIYHDSYINNKLIKNMYYSELPKYVPRLSDVLNIKSDKIFLVEIKNIDGLYNEFVKLLNKYKNKNIYVMSFSNKVIEQLLSYKKTFKLGILNYVFNTNDSLYQRLDFLCILNSLLNDHIISNYSDLEIFSYGIFSKKKYKDVYYIVDE